MQLLNIQLDTWLIPEFVSPNVTKNQHHRNIHPEVIEMFSVSKYIVYYWVERKYVQIRRTENFILIEINPAKQLELRQIIDNSCKANCRIGKA
jgi:hypothetical protein